MKLTKLFLALALFTSVANAQYATLCPLDLTGYNALPIHISAPQHDVMWAATYGYNSGQINSKTFIKTTDAGATFTIGTIPEPQDRGTSCIFARNADTAWVGMLDINNGGSNSIWKTTDGGANWQQQSTNQFSNSSSNLTTIAFFSADSGVVIGSPINGALEIYTTADAGATWSQVPSMNLPASPTNESVYFNSYSIVGNNIWFATGLGRVFYSNDKGYNWNATTIGGNTYGLSMTDENNGVVYTNSHDVYYTTNGGLSWISRTLGINVFALAAIPGVSDFFIFRSDIGIFATTDNFLTYFLISDAMPYTTDPIQMYDASIGWSDAGEFSTDSMMIKISDVLASTISPEANRNSISVFPNPIAHGAAMVSFDLDKASKVSLSLLDLSGKVIRVMNIELNAGKNAVRLDTDGVASGVYLIEMRSEGSLSRSKVVVR
ncbi:MAG: T9SS type A sorting domain-containing protein [Bacteroidetes bacterium]|nr:T9SS type A sorting domain-containing protein [Bacteroidota bacterium]